MDLIADILLAGGALGVAIYCVVLSRRLTRFTDLERGVGGAVAVLSAQVDELTRALEAARSTADRSGETLRALTERAENVSRRLELHVASLHDLEPAPAASTAAMPSFRAADPATSPQPEPEPESAPAPHQLPDAGTAPTFRRAAHAAAPAADAAPGPVPAPIAFRSTAARPAPAAAPSGEPGAGAVPLSAPAGIPSFFARRPGAAAK